MPNWGFPWMTIVMSALCVAALVVSDGSVNICGLIACGGANP